MSEEQRCRAIGGRGPAMELSAMEHPVGAAGRDAVRVAVDATPLRGLPIPNATINSIAVSRLSSTGSVLVYLGTDNGHLLLFTLSDLATAHASDPGSGGSGALGTSGSPGNLSRVVASGASVSGRSLGFDAQLKPVGWSKHEDAMSEGNGSGGAGSGEHSVPGSPMRRESPVRKSEYRGAGGGTEMVLRKRRIMGKSPIQALCALPEARRIAVLYEGQVCLLDMRSLGAMERLSGTKGASALTRAVSAPSPPMRGAELDAQEGAEPGVSNSEEKVGATGFLGKFARRMGSQSELSLSKLSAAQGVGLSRLAVSVRKKILIYEVRAVEPPPQVDKSSGNQRRFNLGWDDATTVSATKLREVVGVDGIITMVWLEKTIMAGIQEEYLLVSLVSGQVTAIFSLPPDLPYPPLLKLFPKDLEVLLTVDKAGIVINTEGQPTSGSLNFSLVPDAIGQTPPYVVVVKQGLTELHHRKTGAKIQSLELAGAGNGRCLVGEDEGGSFVVIASGVKVWCIQQVSLDDQVRDLLKQRQFYEAVRLAEESVTDGSDSAAKERLATVHAEAGFLLLFDLQFELAMDHFLLSDILQPSELFPFFPSFTTRWRTSIPRKRYWSLHPPQQPIATVIENGLWAVQSGLLVLVNEEKVTKLLAQGPSAKATILDHYVGVAIRSFVRYFRAVRERDLDAKVRDGVDTLLLKFYTELNQTDELKLLVSSPNSCVLEEVETTLKAAGQLHPLALLYETKGILSLALQVWQTLALDGAGEPQMVAAKEAARLLESSSDSALVLQHTEWLVHLDQSLALMVLTSSKRSQSLPPGDVLALLNGEDGLVRQRYLLWLVEENGPDAALYHTELALSLAKAALDTLPPSSAGLSNGENSKENKSSPSNDHSLSRRPSLNHDVIRDMLQNFLAVSNEYEAHEVLPLVQGSELWREQVILHKKLGDETAALQILALKLEDSEGARRYCAELGRPEVYLQLLDMYLKPGEGREPMHGAAVRLLHCHGASLDPLKVLEALSPEMSLSMASQTLSRMLRARVHRHREGQIVKHINRHNNLEARVERVEERSRQVCITDDTTCGRCRARIGTKLFVLFPDDSIVCYKCSRLYGEHISPITGQDFSKEPASRQSRSLTRTNSTKI
ncbi:hypothetical protein KC19_VG339500 [Ceratodon purpureus]|uniref:CNH domain-containing protein n=1 Tax=Ceratodon purpureus TaxID=3225 RepID=A0A8T0HYB8_CERPU|nr:hypothetical protein KC19_VG339500 [Ceratodon purpureus]